MAGKYGKGEWNIGIEWLGMRLNIAKWEEGYGNREDRGKVSVNMANGRILWQVAEKQDEVTEKVLEM